MITRQPDALLRPVGQGPRALQAVHGARPRATYGLSAGVGDAKLVLPSVHHAAVASELHRLEPRRAILGDVQHRLAAEICGRTGEMQLGIDRAVRPLNILRLRAGVQEPPTIDSDGSWGV